MDIMDGAFDAPIQPICRYEGTLPRLMGDAIEWKDVVIESH
jgi:hypothetical protein